MEYTVNIDNKGLPLLSIFIIIKKIIIMWHDKGNYNIMSTSNITLSIFSIFKYVQIFKKYFIETKQDCVL